MISFWQWFAKGSGGRSGAARFLDRWLVLHATVAVVMATIIPVTLQDAAVSLLLPLAGILIGLTFAWGGNAQALMQSAEIEDIARFKDGGFEDYVYLFQEAILLILVTLVLWGLAGLGIFDEVWPRNVDGSHYGIVAGILFFFFSATLRECWHVVLGAQGLLLLRYHIRQHRQRESSPGDK